MKKNTIIVTVAMASSEVHEYQGLELRGDPYGYPYVARPSESRIRESKRFKAAIIAGEEGVADSSVSEVWVEGGTGIGRWVDKNMWYVWNEARMNKQDNGMTAKPNRRVRLGVVNAWGFN